MATAPQITQAVDDVAPVTGPAFYGDYINDASPVVRVSLGDQAVAGQVLRLSDDGRELATVTLAAAQVSQGYADVATAGLTEGWNLLAAALEATNGATVAASPSFALGLSTATPAAPVIVSADDDAGASTGALQDGARTDDATPVFHLAEAGLPPPPTGSPGHAPYGGPPLLSGHVELYENGKLLGSAMLSYGGEVTIAPGTLSEGDHVLTAVAVDRAGNASAASAPFHISIGAEAGPTSASPPTHGDDLIQARADAPLVAAAQGNDTIVGGEFADTLWGGQGRDSITGGGDHNEINGNQGEDTLIGRSHIGDQLYGGQGDDLIDARGSTGQDSVNGNMGDDVIHAGSGGGLFWGGQGDDVIFGGAGADWISGDKGRNTVTGGGGPDTFHATQNGETRVTDFHLADGDRVQVDAGADYSFAQVGGDTIIDVAHGGRLVLQGVQATSLTGDWIFSG
jgi:Ca2+-binding RTX toxin-like protein